MNSSEQSEEQTVEGRFRRLIEIGNEVLAELDLEAVLQSVVKAARELTGARYVGIDEGAQPEIGNPPSKRGVFSVPITVRGETYGNLYMTEKQGAEDFDDSDEEAAVTLAGWAGIAIENARLYTNLSERETEVEQALRRAETSVDIARTVGGETDVERVLDLIVKRARALVEARALLVLLHRGDHLFVAAHAGEVGIEAESLEVPIEDAVFGGAIQERVSHRLERGTPPSRAHLRERLGAETALVVPMLFRGRAVGLLVALDREAGGIEFDQEDLRLLQSFASSAATAVATAQTVESERLRQQVESAERERERWARELHDDTLQNLAAIRIQLATALQSSGDRRGARIESAAEEAIVHIESQINDLNRLINDLRPAALERLGLPGALQALADENAARSGVEIEAKIELSSVRNGDEDRIVYRLVQEALTNVLKHANAAHVDLTAEDTDGAICIVIRDDGDGFDTNDPTAGRGLRGMRERIELLGGEIEVTSSPGQGTTVSASVPLQQP
ncbi:MAG TPA: GAF domain-containing sensor histidine kinase [Solirubrobacterales bacterium]|jgi:signal transduction histidine kinase|nr:GAF domain-containing sensor histidine kinase [Solirubrobacterales bacterium]